MLSVSLLSGGSLALVVLVNICVIKLESLQENPIAEMTLVSDHRTHEEPDTVANT